MYWKSSFGKKLTFGLASVLAFAATSSNDADAQKKPVAQAKTSEISSAKLNKVTKAVFAKYDMLNAAATQTAFVKYLKQTKTTEARMNLMSVLNGRTVNVAKLEKAVQPFVVGLTEEDVQVRLNVIMLDYYQTSLEKKKLSMGKVEFLMESRAKALEDAVFGKSTFAKGSSAMKSAKVLKARRRKLTARR